MATTPSSPGRFAAFQHPALLAGGLFFATVLFYWKVQHFQFVGLDDHVYVWNNPYVINGIKWEGVRYVFGNAVFSTYHPLTWLSLMADSSLFGLTTQGYHRTSIALHAANSTLVFLFLRRATGAALPAAFVAALFAIHPLNVQPVAWISSRKDVLSGFFFLAGLWAYAAIPIARVYSRIALVTLAYILALLAKPSVITFPFVLLLLDYWPLGRCGSPPSPQWKTIRRLTVEKIPLFIVLAISLAATSLSAGQSLALNSQIPLVNRIQDAIVNYAIYMGKTFAPVGLTAQYPYDANGWPALTVVSCAVLLIAVTAVAWFARKRAPFIPVGWLWFLGVMLPLCGILIVGAHSRADRYMYMPMIGVLFVVTWGCYATANRFNLSPILLRVGAIGIVASYAVAGSREQPHWANERALAEKMLDAHEWNPMGHYLMGKALEGEGDISGALEHFQRQLSLTPSDPTPHAAIGGIQMKLAAYDSAAYWYGKAIELSPNAAEAYFGLASVEMQRGNSDRAREYLDRCLQVQPYHQAALHALADLNRGGTSADDP